MPSQFIYIPGSTRLNGQNFNDGIVLPSGIIIPVVIPSQDTIIQFSAKAVSANGFSVGATNLINKAVVEYSGTKRESQLAVRVDRGAVQGATTIAKVAGIKTGFQTTLVTSIFALLFVDSLLMYVWLKK